MKPMVLISSDLELVYPSRNPKSMQRNIVQKQIFTCKDGLGRIKQTQLRKQDKEFLRSSKALFNMQLISGNGQDKTERLRTLDASRQSKTEKLKTAVPNLKPALLVNQAAQLNNSFDQNIYGNN